MCEIPDLRCLRLNKIIQGILVGTITNEQFVVQDAYPLFHSRIMAPTLEAAFQLIDTILLKNQNILGIYESLVNNHEVYLNIK